MLVRQIDRRSNSQSNSVSKLHRFVLSIPKRLRRQTHIRVLTVFFAVVVGGLLFNGCSSAPRMQTVPKQPIDISGNWSIDRRESDDVRARLRPLAEKQEQRFRRLDRAIEEGPGRSLPPDNLPGKESEHDGRRDPGSDLSTSGWLRQERQRDTLILIALLGPATKMEIHQSTREMRIVSDKGDGTRVLVPGEKTALFVTAGGFEVTSGWTDKSFVVSSRGTADNGIQMIERYSLIDGGKRLEELLEAHLPAFGKQVFRYVYNRAPAE
jgi:outer membrane murein-binding lipoprotein Lpp